MRTVHIVHHVHVQDTGEEDVKLIGAYSNRELAVAAVRNFEGQPGFSDAPEIVDEVSVSFTISEYPVDKDHWTEGFFTYTS